MKTFVVVYDNRSIVKAASLLGVTRSAVSQSLKALEREVRGALFVRDSKKVQPTLMADRLYGLMSPFLRDLDETLQKIETGRKAPGGHLRIGAPLDFGSQTITDKIAKFRKSYPEVTFELVLGIPAKQLELLIAGKLDIAFIDNGEVFSKSYPISVETIQREEFVLAVESKFYANNIKPAQDLSSLRELPVIDYLPHAPVIRMWFKHHFGRTHAELNVVYSAESVRGVLNAISAGMGIGVVPSHFIREGEYKNLKIIETEKKGLVNHISLALPLSKKLSLTEKTFISFFKSGLKS